MIEPVRKLRIAVVAGTRENAFAPALETELRHLGIETSGVPQGEIISPGQVSGVDGVVFVVDEGFAAAWGRLSFREFDRYGFGNIQERFWVTDSAHRDLAEKLRKRFDPKSSALSFEGSYDGDAAISLARQIVDRLQGSFPANELVKAQQEHASPLQGFANPSSAEKTARRRRLEEEQHFQSGNAMLGELLSSFRFGRSMTQEDRKALRLASALEETRLETSDAAKAGSILRGDISKLKSLSVVYGYLLSTNLFEESAQSALGRMIWRCLATTGRVGELSERADLWSALGLEQERIDIEQEAESDEPASRRLLSPQFGKLLVHSATLMAKVSPSSPFNSAYLLACIIGLPGEKVDRSAIKALERLGADPRDLRPMFRDWLAIQNPDASPELYNTVLGVTAEEAKGSYSSEYLRTEAKNDPLEVDPDKRIQELRREIATLQEEWTFPTDFFGKPLREDLQSAPRAAIQKKIDAAHAELAQLEAQAESVKPTPDNERLIDHGWQDGVAGIATGMVQFEDERDVEDALEIEAYATRFARVIALRDTELPLSVGLFGEWGSGKTYFMKLLRQEIRRLGEKNDANWCSRVVPIRFNAWHYLDTNLWASLVTEMFDQLFDYLAGPARDTAKRLEAAEKVMKEIENGKGAVSEVKAELNLLEKEKRWAEKEILEEEKVLRIAERNASRARKLIAARMDDLKALLPGVLENSEWQTALKAFGLDKAIGSWNQLEGRLNELRSLHGRVRALGSAMGSGWWGFVSLLVLLVILALVPIALGKLAVAVAANEHLQSITMAIGSASGLAVSLAGWLAAQANRAGKLLGQAEKLEKAAKKARAKKEKSPQLQRLRDTAIRLAKQKELASERLNQARAKVRRLEEELREMRPERRLLRFIEERAAAKDYRQHLGLVSLVRRDFRELSRLFTEKKDGRTKWEKLLGGPEKSIDRIVLYVDDLDRCQPQRVVEVLEAVHLLLDFPLFVAVVAVDSRWVKQSLRAHYSKLLSGAVETSGDTNSPLSRRGPNNHEEDHATPLDYLEKIFHIPFHLPQMTRHGFTNLIGKLAGRAELREAVPLNRPVEGDMGNSGEKTQGVDASSEGDMGLPVVETAEPRADFDFSDIGGESEEKTVTSSGQVLTTRSKALAVVRLEDWEVLHLNDYATLVQTPRAAKRFLNTYRLVRAGLAREDWNSFQGDRDMSGEFRIAMLLLAAAAGSPALAREWFKGLRNAEPSALFLAEDQKKSQDKWQKFKQVYDSTFVETTFDLTRDLFAKWLERVERFSF